MNNKQTKLLLDLLSQPTAPFRESHVVRFVQSVLNESGVPSFTDNIGNIVVGVSSRDSYIRLLRTRDKEPVRLFVAHMDHPGFHGVKWLSPNRLAIKWHGGSPVKHLSGHSVWLADDERKLAVGKLMRPALVKGKWGIDSAQVILSQGKNQQTLPDAKNLFGSFLFRAPVWQSGKRIYANAADDLTGVFAILNTAMCLWQKHKLAGQSFLGLLTRAEEVGFVGAVGHFNLGWLERRTRPLVCISLEASRTLPNAEIGKGPIVRLGDRRTVFQANGLKLLADIADKVLPGRHQKRIMDGGSCEATAATAFGIPAIGISLPLGNYHNQGLEGGPDCPKSGGPAPEFVHMDDIAGELKLCLALMRLGLAWDDPWEKQKEQLKKNFRRYQRLLS
ncbi:MAG: hypothetical protein OEY67_01445 [Gammaproteobacteria bacterium]|nr:hypothetical protein [Gammaproteobacteria bacterium]